jgi:hypothetical protein
MDRQENDEQETSQAWFVVTDPGDAEHFAAIDGSDAREIAGAGMHLQVAPPDITRCATEESETSPTAPKTEVEPDRSSMSKEETPTMPAPVRITEQIEPTDTSAKSEQSDAISVLAVEAERFEDAPASTSNSAQGASPVSLAEGSTEPAEPERPGTTGGIDSPMQSNPTAHASAFPPQFGFTQSELIRIGGNRPSAPSGVVGLVVTARTPQRVRLGQVTVLHSARTVIGRGRVNLFVDDPDVANVHAVITFEHGEQLAGFRLYTHNSAPVMVNGASVGELVLLASGDRIVIGATELVFLQVPLLPGGVL